MRLNNLLTHLTWALLAMTAMGGCGGSDRHAVVPVRGQMFYRSQPAAGAMVVLHPQGNAAPDQWPKGFPRATVESDGAFKVATYADGDGAPAGEYKIVIYWPMPEPGAAAGHEVPTVDRLGGAYADPERSVWQAKVDGPQTELPRIDLN